MLANLKKMFAKNIKKFADKTFINVVCMLFIVLCFSSTFVNASTKDTTTIINTTVINKNDETLLTTFIKYEFLQQTGFSLLVLGLLVCSLVTGAVAFAGCGICFCELGGVLAKY